MISFFNDKLLHFNVINPSPTYVEYKSWIRDGFITCNSMFNF